MPARPLRKAWNQLSGLRLAEPLSEKADEPARPPIVSNGTGAAQALIPERDAAAGAVVGDCRLSGTRGPLGCGWGYTSRTSGRAPALRMV